LHFAESSTQADGAGSTGASVHIGRITPASKVHASTLIRQPCRYLVQARPSTRHPGWRRLIPWHQFDCVSSASAGLGIKLHVPDLGFGPRVSSTAHSPNPQPLHGPQSTMHAALRTPGTHPAQGRWQSLLRQTLLLSTLSQRLTKQRHLWRLHRHCPAATSPLRCATACRLHNLCQASPAMSRAMLDTSDYREEMFMQE
jgi:hypothetical protein